MSIITKLKNSVLFKNTFIYTLLQLLNKGVPFLLLPILTRYLTTEDYGMIAIYNTFVRVAIVFVGLGLPSAIGINFFQLEKKELKNYIGNIFNILIVSSLLVSLVLFIFQEILQEKFNIPILWMYVAVAVGLTRVITDINLTLWRSEKRAKSFAFYEISQTIFNVSVSLLFVIVLKEGWEGRSTGSALAAVIFGLMSILFIKRRGYVTRHYSVKHMRDGLRYGIPLIPHWVALWVRSSIDVVFISLLLGSSDAGIYSIGFQLGSVVGIVVAAFNNAYVPYIYEKLNHVTEKDKRKLVKFTYLYFIIVVIFAIVLSQFFSLILPYLLAEDFQRSEKYIIWVSLAYAFNGMYLMTSNYIHYTKKTPYLSTATLSVSIIHVPMSYTLISMYGAIGAAYTSVITFFLTFLFVWFMSNKVYPMPWFGSKKIEDQG